MNYEKKYKEALDRVRELLSRCINHRDRITKIYRVEDIESIFPELAESEDERIRKWCISHFKAAIRVTKDNAEYQEYLNNKVIPWLEKQSEQKFIWHDESEEPERDKLILLIMQSGTPIVAKVIEPNHTFNHGERWAYIDDLIENQEQKETTLDEEEIVHGIRRGVAISLINHIDVNSKGICLSNMECEDIEKAIVNEDWDKVYGYMKKKLEKQGEKPNEFTYTHEAETGNGNIKALVTKEVKLPKFRVGDVMRTHQEVDNNITDGLPVVVSIDDTYYHCTNELIAIKDQDDYEYPPINRKHKPINKVEPKFKVGDWIVWQNKCYKVNYNGCGYELIDQMGLRTSLEYGTVDESAHFWSIQDAKDGDVLYHSDTASNGIFIFKELLKYKFSEKVICYCDYDSEDGFCLGKSRFCCWSDAKILHPATKEKRDLLFQKMREAGYKWNFDRKELKKIK